MDAHQGAFPSSTLHVRYHTLMPQRTVFLFFYTNESFFSDMQFLHYSFQAEPSLAFLQF